jgi:hypothetical protein
VASAPPSAKVLNSYSALLSDHACVFGSVGDVGPAGLITRGSVITYFVGVRRSVAMIISSAASVRTSENATWTPSGASFGDAPPPMSTEPNRSAPPGGTTPLSGLAADRSIGRTCLLLQSMTLGEHSSTAGLAYGPKNTRLPSGNGVASPPARSEARSRARSAPRTTRKQRRFPYR